MARHWFAKSAAEVQAEAGKKNVRALLRLAELHDHGWRGVEADPDRAVALLQQAAEAGSAVAAYRLGDRYHRGEGADEDPVQAAAWWHRAAELGDADAMSNLFPDLIASDDPGRQAAGYRMLVRAAEAGQPYARDQLRHVLAGTSAPPVSLAELARTPLEELAAQADDDAEGGELAESFEVEAEPQAIDDLIGAWLDKAATLWPDLTVKVELDGEPFDFPGSGEDLPSSVLEDMETITITLHAGVRHVECAVFFSSDDGTWDVTLSSYEPHPTPEEQAALLGAIRELRAKLED
jgi:hypothetical protein